MFKYGYHTGSWGWKIDPNLFPSVLNQISEAGFKGFETHDEDIYPFLNDPKKIRDLLSEKQLHMASIHMFGYFYDHISLFPDPLFWFERFRTRRWWTRKMVPKVINFAAKVGCDHFSLIGGNRRKGGAKEKDYEDIAKVLNNIGKEAKDYGIRTTYQPMADYIVSQMHELDKLYELIDLDLVQLTFDTAQWAAAGGDSVEPIKKYHEKINHVHFRDISNGEFVELGTGEIDFVDLAKLLKSVNYQEWIILETDWTVIESKKLDPFESAKKAKEYQEKYLSKI